MLSKMICSMKTVTSVLTVAIICVLCAGFSESIPNNEWNNSDISYLSSYQSVNSHLKRHHHKYGLEDINHGNNVINDIGTIDRKSANFLLIDYLNDGEMERRISFNGITAKETSVANSG